MPCAEVCESLRIVFTSIVLQTWPTGPEHTAAGGGAAMPSYCLLPIFHVPLNPNTAPAGVGYVSQDGHQFACRNPVVMQQAFHV